MIVISQELVPLATSEALTPLALAVGLAGLLAPFLTALINRPSWSSQLKQLVALVVAIVLGIIGLVLGGAISNVPATPAAWGIVLFSVIGISQTLYAVVLKTTGVGPALEKATSPKDAGLHVAGQPADISSLPSTPAAATDTTLRPPLADPTDTTGR